MLKIHLGQHIVVATAADDLLHWFIPSRWLHKKLRIGVGLSRALYPYRYNKNLRCVASFPTISSDTIKPNSIGFGESLFYCTVVSYYSTVRYLWHKWTGKKSGQCSPSCRTVIWYQVSITIIWLRSVLRIGIVLMPIRIRHSILMSIRIRIRIWLRILTILSKIQGNLFLFFIEF